MSNDRIKPVPGESEVQALGRELREELHSLERRIADEGETTRRHFDVVAEVMRDTMKMLAESVTHHTIVLNAHEGRIKTLEDHR